MSTQIMNDRLVDHIVEVQEINKDDNLLKIVNNVETRLIQESIQEKWESFREVKSNLKDFIVPIVSGVVSISSLVTLLNVEFNERNFLPLVATMTFVLGLFGAIIGYFHISSLPYSQRKEIRGEINSSRIELAEKMLNIEILKKNTVDITGEWDEVMALDQNGDYVKILIRIVNDKETGLETIESKMLKNQ